MNLIKNAGLHRGLLGGVLLIVFLMLSVGCAQAGISYKWTSQIVIEDMPDCDIQDVYDALSPVNGDLLLHPDPVDPTIWYVNRTLLVDRSNFTLSPDRGVTEIRIDNHGLQTYTIHGTPGTSDGIIMDGITYTGWNITSMTPRTENKKTLEISKGNVHNTTFQYISQVYLYNVINGEFSELTFRNCSEITSKSSSLRVDDSTGVTAHDLYTYDSIGIMALTNTTYSNFSDIYAENIEWYGIGLTEASDHNTFRRVTVIDFDDYLDYRSDSGAFYTMSCNYTTGYDFYINGTPWSSLAPGGYFQHFENITIKNTGHNSIDLHNVRDSTFVNCSLYAPPADSPWADGHGDQTNNVLITAGIASQLHSSNISMTDIYCYNAGMSIQTGVDHIYLENLTLEGEGPHIYASADYFTLKNFRFIPNVGEELDSSLTLEIDYEKPERLLNNTIIDGDVYGLSILQENRNRFLNVKYTYNNYKNHTRYFYGDFVVKDATGSPLDGVISVTNDISTNEKYSNADGWGENKQTFNVTSGRTALPDSNRYDSIALTDSWNDPNNTVIDFIHSAAIFTSQGDVTLNNINPNSNWYRSNPQNSRYTIVAIVNDSANTHITGYAPSVDENEFTTGDSVTYQVWTSEDVDSISWKKGGVEVNNDSLSYTTTYTDDPVTISFSATDANGDISQTWDYYPLVAAFSANNTTGTAPATIQFTDGSQGSPTSWAWDFENDGTVDSTEQNPIWYYESDGSYDVNLTVSNELGSDSEVKEDYIVLTNPYVPPLLVSASVIVMYFFMRSRRWW